MAGGARRLNLGFELDLAGGGGPGRPCLYDADELATHAVCFGMTGSGKTGLCLVLLEELARLGIPFFAVDPKGDLANLLLAFPGLSGPEFEPWVDPDRARAAGITTSQLAGAEALRWRDGLAASGLTGADVRALRDGAEMVLYTPGSTAGRPVNVLGGFAPPAGLDAAAWEEDPEPPRARIAGTVAALLGLVEAQADPARSPEAIFLARLFELRWRAGGTLTLESIIRELQDPGEPMRTLGAIDIETMLPRARRMALALSINALLASPSFSAWTKGDPLDIGRMAGIADGAGRPRASILYIAHLDDRERVFFVTAFLQALLTWMRAQPGTAGLRALFYMDEIFGYFPPQGNPPAKDPLLTLLKQGRAFGLGTLLATQNPVDVDYKGLGNAGTWFIGRLQTEQDRSRLLDGLASTGPIDRSAVESALAGLPPRTFLMHSARRPGLTAFTTRWTMSYLRGPMTREEIRRLAPAPEAGSPAADPPASPAAAGPGAGRAVREGAPAGVPEWFAPAPGGALMRPAIRARARLLFENAAAGLRHAVEEDLVLPLAGSIDPGGLAWDRATPRPGDLVPGPPGGVLWEDLPDPFRSAAGWRKAAASLKSHLSIARSLPLGKCAPLKLTSHPDESKAQFAARCAGEARRRQEEETRVLKGKYEERIRKLRERADKERRELERDQQQLEGRRMDEIVATGETLLGIFLGGRRRSLSGAAGRRRITSNAGARADRSAAEYDAARQELDRMGEEAERALDALEARWTGAAADIVEVPVRPKKSGVEILELGLLWTPAESEK